MTTENLTPYQLFQLEKYGNILPTYNSILPNTTEPNEDIEQPFMYEVYIFENENGNDY